MEATFGWMLGILIATLISAVVIWIVGQLNLGMSVKGFGAAFVAALVVAVISAGAQWLLWELNIFVPGGLAGTIVNVLVAAVVLLLAGNVVQGLKVRGFSGALIAAVAMAVVGYFVTAALSPFLTNL
jgi:putative membrane protein